MTNPRRITEAGREAVARRVASRRGELDLTQEELALKAEVAHRTVQYLESGDTWPQAATLAAVARALDLDAGELRELACAEPSPAGS